MTPPRTRKRTDRPPQAPAAPAPETVEIFKLVGRIIVVQKNGAGEITGESEIGGFELHRAKFGQLEQLAETEWAPQIQAAYARQLEQTPG